MSIWKRCRDPTNMPKIKSFSHWSIFKVSTSSTRSQASTATRTFIKGRSIDRHISVILIRHCPVRSKLYEITTPCLDRYIITGSMIGQLYGEAQPYKRNHNNWSILQYNLSTFDEKVQWLPIPIYTAPSPNHSSQIANQNHHTRKSPQSPLLTTPPKSLIKNSYRSNFFIIP